MWFKFAIDLFMPEEHRDAVFAFIHDNRHTLRGCAMKEDGLPAFYSPDFWCARRMRCDPGGDQKPTTNSAPQCASASARPRWRV